jgi:hypothetical protein
MEQILPGVSIEVRPEGLIIPGQVSISSIGIVGTSSRGPVGEAVIIGSQSEARQVFGPSDAFVASNAGDELSLVRAIELAYDHGALDVIAVRIANGATAAQYLVASASNDCCLLTAATPGSWANQLEINVGAADEPAVVEDEALTGGGTNFNLLHATVAESIRNTVTLLRDGSTIPEVPTIVYNTGAPGAGEVDINTGTGGVTFPVAEAPGAADVVMVTYVVPAANSVRVTLRHGISDEVFTAASGAHLVRLLNLNSDLATGADGTSPGELPTVFASATEFQAFGSGSNASGTNGAAGADYAAGLDVLLDEPAHIIVAAGQSHTDIAADLTAHVAQASSDLNKRERIGIVGSGKQPNGDAEDLGDILEHNVNSDRVVMVAPGVQARDAASGETVSLQGGYAAAAVAGMLAGRSSHISLTNKRLAVAGLEETYTTAELRRLVQARVLALEAKFGFRVVKGITSSTNTAWHQITTRRIVDEAKFGVRSAANPYIGLLNNERVRAAMRSTINSFLTGMVEDEKLVSYELEVTATRDEERRGIARVTIVLRPTFSIDFIKVTMFLE